MLITCNNCNKNFEIDSSLIPEKGRLLQCYSCSYQWFFKKRIIDKLKPIITVNKPGDLEVSPIKKKILVESENPESIDLLDRSNQDSSLIKKISIKDKTERKKNNELIIKSSTNKIRYNILSLTIVFIISFIALILILDTFQKPISSVVPNIELILYNLYESINDIVLFFTDLI